MGKKPLLLSVLATAFAIAQTTTPPKTAARAIPTHPFATDASRDATIAELRKEVKDLKDQVDELQKSIWQHGLDIYTLKRASATFDPASPNTYIRLDNDAGVFWLSLGKVEPYLDGYRVDLEIGNPLAATFKGFKLKTKWAPRLNNYQGKYMEWLKKNREKTFDFTDDLLSGRWNGVSIILPETKADDFGSLEISIDVNTISMGKSLSR